MSCRLFTRTRGFAMEWTRLALTPSPLGPSGWTRAKHLTRSSSRLPCAAALEYLVVFCPVLFAITIGHIPPYFATYALLRIPRTFCLRFTFVSPYKYACILQTTMEGAAAEELVIDDASELLSTIWPWFELSSGIKRSQLELIPKLVELN